MAFDSTTAKLAGMKSSRQGIPNKMNREIREAFQKLVMDNLPKIQQWLDKVGEDNPDKALTLLAKYAEFVLPKLSKSEIQMEEKEAERKINPDQLSVETLLELRRAYENPQNKGL